MNTPNLPITYAPGFVLDADGAFDRLWSELAWERRGATPRREYYSNEVGVPYAYGNPEFSRSYEPQPWHPVMLEIKALLEAHTGTRFEVCFLNGYENSKDSLGWHADDSPEMDDTRPIAIVSLGAEREIMFRPQADRADITKLKLQHGSLCLMHAGMQDTHYHRIPRAGFDCGPRISLTYRGYCAT